MNITPIAHIENDFVSKFGIPRQSGILNKASSIIVFEPQFRSREAIRGIEEYSHLWLIWQFSKTPQNGFHPTVRPPRLGGNTRVGVFATRSPFRPNSLGLSSVRLLRVIHDGERAPMLEVSGADLMSGTPIFDIKPYVKYSDSHPDAVCSFADACSTYALKVDVPPQLAAVAPDKLEAITDILASDPRPAYQNDPDRVYTFDYAAYSVSFRVENGVATVTDIKKVR